MNSMLEAVLKNILKIGVWVIYTIVSLIFFVASIVYIYTNTAIITTVYIVISGCMLYGSYIMGKRLFRKK